MTAEEWQCVWALFRAASELPPDEQRPFVESAPAPPHLVSEVLALLDENGSQNDHPSPGREYGRYTIVELLGRGGVGEVYLARDSDLGRPVAIKFLNSRAKMLPASVERLVREAQAASALNHPNLVTVHDVLRTGSDTALVTEFIEGEALRGRCGVAWPVWQVARWGAQIARGLSAAHAGKIVHGDIKPENVILRPDGYVKVLDFGLARRGETPWELEEALAGTAGYMSPEQTRGEPLTPASDVFSLGILLLELAGGKHPFLEPTVSATTRAINERDATLPDPIKDLPGNRGFADLLESMLDKESVRRPTAAEVAERLDRMAPATAPRRQKWTWIVAALPIVVFGVWWASWRESPIVVPEPVALTSYSGVESQPAFSPDGARIAFVWSGPDGDNRDIYVKTIGQEDLRRLTIDPLDDYAPAWSPDGSTIAFLRRANGGGDSLVVAVPAGGGTERIVGRVVDPRGFVGFAWWPDSQSLILHDGTPRGYSLVRLYLHDGHKQPLTSASYGHDFRPVVSLDGKRVAFFRAAASGQAVCLLELDGPSAEICSPRVATRVNSMAWLPGSRGLLLSESRGLHHLRLDRGRVIADVKVSDGEFSGITGDRFGRRFAFGRQYSDNNIWRLDVATGHGTKFIASSEEDSEPEFSPDGQRIVFRSGRTGNMEIYVCQKDGSNLRQLTSLRAHTGSARWSPDGSRIVFDGSGTRGPGDRPLGRTNIYIVSANGGQPRRLTDDRVDCDVPSWSRDAKWIYYVAEIGDRHEVWKMPAEGGAAVKVSGTEMFDVTESDDGRWLYYSKPEVAKGVWRRRVEGGPEELVPGTAELSYRYWEVRGSLLFFVRGGAERGFTVLPLAGGGARSLGVGPRQWFNGPRGMTASPDGSTILYTQEDLTLGDILMIELPGVR